MTLGGAAVPVGVRADTHARDDRQEAFARALVDLPATSDVAKHLVTTSPDVSISTGLGGWIDKRGVFAPTAEEVYESDEASPLRWTPGRTVSTSSSASPR